MVQVDERIGGGGSQQLVMEGVELDSPHPVGVPPSSNTASDFPVILHQTYKGYTESYQRPAVRQNLFTSVHTYNAAQTRGLDLCRRLGTKLQRHLGTIRLNATGCTGTGCREDSGARADHIPDDIKS